MPRPMRAVPSGPSRGEGAEEPYWALPVRHSQRNDGSSAVLIMSSNLLAIYDISQFKMRSVDPVYTGFST